MEKAFGPEAAGILGIVCVVAGVIVLVGLVIAVLYLLTLYRALAKVAPHNRLMEPGLVWLSLIPLFNVIWAFIIASRLPDSLRNEFREQGRDDGTDYGKGIATTNAVIGVLSMGISLASNVLPPDVRGMTGCAQGPLGLVSLVLFIVFWVKIAGYSSQLSAGSDFSQRDLERKLDRFADDDDDYGAPRHDPSKGPPDSYKEGDPGRYQ